MRSAIFILFLLCVSSCSTQKNKVDQMIQCNASKDELELTQYSMEDFNLKYFKSFPKFTSNIYLIDSINPVDYYAYWECVFKDGLSDENKNGFINRGQRVIYNGDSLQFYKIAEGVNTNRGFFVQCAPIFNCYYYIVGVRPSRQTMLFDTDNLLKGFIGKIDNEEEAILSANIEGYHVDHDSLIGGCYRERTNDYLLYLMEIEEDSLFTQKSVRAILTKDGKFKVIDKKIYLQTENRGID